MKTRRALTAATAPLLFVLALAAGCGGTPANGGGGSGGSGAAGGTGGGGGMGGAASGSSSDTGVGGSFVGSGGAGAMIPVRALPGLASITFHERTGGTEPTPYTFTVDGPELGARLDDPLATDHMDIPGASSEFYDVYYSNEDGTFNLDGSYLTISGVFLQTLPAGGGLNLAEIGLNFVDASTEYGNYVASHVTLGDNAAPGTVPNCIDGDLQTHTTMGNTANSSERLRLTLGFLSTSGVPK
ncbi:hypothetical protein [Polyangium aurulentum]|uniref:hypothetical protein n=1 Tax=Polyangium aurulentum TaxID=2567896 RepID=UPI00146D3BA5|nr:hypothetical protein [Polyangium aurulentum]UQA58482.1 hypothetical protein E8A73_045770 [Polyangium aurulentum]